MSHLLKAASGHLLKKPSGHLAITPNGLSLSWSGVWYNGSRTFWGFSPVTLSGSGENYGHEIVDDAPSTVWQTITLENIGGVYEVKFVYSYRTTQRFYITFLTATRPTADGIIGSYTTTYSRPVTSPQYNTLGDVQVSALT
jgi:hypothetical protein